MKKKSTDGPSPIHSFHNHAIVILSAKLIRSCFKGIQLTWRKIQAHTKKMLFGDAIYSVIMCNRCWCYKIFWRKRVHTKDTYCKLTHKYRLFSWRFQCKGLLSSYISIFNLKYWLFETNAYLGSIMKLCPCWILPQQAHLRHLHNESSFVVHYLATNSFKHLFCGQELLFSSAFLPAHYPFLLFLAQICAIFRPFLISTSSTFKWN